MHFYRNTKDGQNYLILHSNEWHRLKNQSRPPEKPLNEQKDYVKSLIEKSREWTKTWPDHERGLLSNYEKKQKSRREADVATVKSEKERRKYKVQNRSMEAIEKARQKVFAESCYGKRLLSAFLESKTLEERDVQVQFLKELKEKEITESKKYKSPVGCSLELDKRTADDEQCRKSTAIKMAIENKERYEKQKAEAAKIKKAQMQDDLENIQLTRELLIAEQKAEGPAESVGVRDENFIKCFTALIKLYSSNKILKVQARLLDKEAFEQYKAFDMKSKEKRAKSIADRDAKIIKCQKEKEELDCKIKKVLEKCKLKDRPWTKQICENFAQHQEEKNKRIDMLIEINSKLGKYRSDEQERTIKEKEKRNHENTLLIAEANKLMAESTKEKRRMELNERTSDRQCLIIKSDKSRLKKKDMNEFEETCPLRYGPCNKLMSALKKRIQQPSSWTGANGAHQDFARNADEMLRDCKYKNAGRRVVDDYIKYNRLDSLDVPNYY